MAQLNDICSEEGVTWNFVPGAKDFKARVSALTPENPWWVECERFFRSAYVLKTQMRLVAISPAQFGGDIH